MNPACTLWPHFLASVLLAWNVLVLFLGLIFAFFYTAAIRWGIIILFSAFTLRPVFLLKVLELNKWSAGNMGEACICVYELPTMPQNDVAWNCFLTHSSFHQKFIQLETAVLGNLSLDNKHVTHILKKTNMFSNLVVITLITIYMLAPLVGGLMQIGYFIVNLLF